jgi:hypothetical protein
MPCATYATGESILQRPATCRNKRTHRRAYGIRPFARCQLSSKLMLNKVASMYCYADNLREKQELQLRMWRVGTKSVYVHLHLVAIAIRSAATTNHCGSVRPTNARRGRLSSSVAMSAQVCAMWIEILAWVEIANVRHPLPKLLRAPIIDPRSSRTGCINTAGTHEATHRTIINLFTDSAPVCVQQWSSI